MWDYDKALKYLASFFRVRGERNGELPVNAPMNSCLASTTLCMLAKLVTQADFNLFVSGLKAYLITKSLGKCTMLALLNGAFTAAVRRKLKEPRPPIQRQSRRCALEVYSQERSTRHHFLPLMGYRYEKIDVECGVLCVPGIGKFFLVDALFLLESNPMTLVGLRMNTAGGRHTTASTVKQFTELLAADFNGLDELSRDMLWEVIYLQHADNTPMNGWQRCGAVNSNSVSEEKDRELATLWKQKVHQYQVSLSSEGARSGEALRSEE
ncbi:retrotransposon hot spot (RHS) protein, putative [Trypanosoma cruzi marinkellei]|uniref:Retrotransposon hot spot (RHS) protein, putative n=1 Tax=Trypanosoma cruzi marinkellei TaxID=85056 RepID=K2MVR4_TRYCR|nr:retrotransposon hot spot (RHS) protein, putative [Trypanosoma cruzi marinkellei]